MFDSVSDEDLELVLQTVVSDAIEDVMSCTNLQPSVPGVVCEVISEIVRSSVDLERGDADDVLNGHEAGSQQPPTAELSRHSLQVR